MYKNESSMDLNIFYKCFSPQIKQNWVKKSSFFVVPISWNNLQDNLKLPQMDTMGEFKLFLQLF